MSRKSLRSTIDESIFGVLWRFGLLFVAALCLMALLSLRRWHETFAASPEWAEAAADERLPWSPEIAAAAKTIPPSLHYRSEESFRQALEDAIERRSTDERDTGPLQALRRAKTKRRELAEKSRTESAARLQLDEAVKSLVANVSQAKRRDLLATLVQQGTAARDTLEDIADQDVIIEAQSTGRKLAFKAAVSSARPVDGFWAQLVGPRQAIRIGDEDDTLHFLYVLTWYALEGAIVALVCLVIVPLILRFTGETNPGSTRATLAAKLKEWLRRNLGEQAAAIAGKSIATALVGSVAIASVSAAAPGRPGLEVVEANPAPRVIGPERTDAPGPAEPGARPAPSAAPKPAPSPTASPNPTGGDPKDVIVVVSPPTLPPEGDVTELSKAVTELRQQVERVAGAASGLAASAGQVTGSLGQLGSTVRGMAAGDAQERVRQADRHVQLVDDLTAVRDAERDTAAQVDAVRAAVEDVKAGVATVNASVETVGKALGPVQEVMGESAGEVLRTGAIRDGKLIQTAPWTRYHVDDAALATLSRALPEPRSEEESALLNALADMKGRPHPDWYGQFCQSLRHHAHQRAASTKKVDAVLQRLMPLILKVSRVRR